VTDSFQRDAEYRIILKKSENARMHNYARESSKAWLIGVQGVPGGFPGRMGRDLRY
jgi:hypothetical protein